MWSELTNQCAVFSSKFSVADNIHKPMYLKVIAIVNSIKYLLLKNQAKFLTTNHWYIFVYSRPYSLFKWERMLQFNKKIKHCLLWYYRYFPGNDVVCEQGRLIRRASGLPHNILCMLCMELCCTKKLKAVWHKCRGTHVRHSDTVIDKSEPTKVAHISPGWVLKFTRLVSHQRVLHSACTAVFS